MARPNRRRKDLLAEVAVIGFPQHVEECFAVEQVYAHVRQAVAAAAGDAVGVDPRRRGADHIQFLFGLWFFQKPDHSPGVVQPHDTQRVGFAAVYRDGGDGHVGRGLDVRFEHLLKVHLVQLVAGEDQHVLDTRLLDVAQVPPHGVGGALIPVGVLQRLLRGQHLDETTAERIEVVGRADVTMQADRVELGKHVAAVQPAVDAIRQGDVDQPVFTRHRHGRFGAVFRQWIEPRPLSAAEHQSEHVFHAVFHGRLIESGG